jgi:hypothetical protein
MVKMAGRESDKFMLRLPDGLRDAIKAAAEHNSRSMNSEIVARLIESLERDFGDGREKALPSIEDIETFATLIQLQTAKLSELVAALEERKTKSD